MFFTTVKDYPALVARVRENVGFEGRYNPFLLFHFGGKIFFCYPSNDQSSDLLLIFQSLPR